MREDIPLGHQLAQVTHAAGESAKLGELPPGTHAVVLHAHPEDFVDFKYVLAREGIEFVLIQEPDEPYCGEIMAIGIKPQPRSKKLKKLMQHFKLAK